MIEMATSMVVAGIVTTVAVVTLGPAVEHAKVRSAANAMAGDFQYAQALAVRHRRPISVVVDSAGRQVVIRDRDQITNSYRTRPMGSDSDFSLDQLSTTGSSVEFFINGVAGSTITVTLGLRGFSRQVRVSRAGKIRVRRTP